MLPASAARVVSAAYAFPLYDANVFCGNYPFRRLPGDTPHSLTEFLTGVSLTGCVLTPFESIFYRQPWKALEPWLTFHFELPFQPRYWLVVNPLMPGWKRDLARAIDYESIAGVRLFPRYHGYKLGDDRLAEVIAAAANVGLPLNLTARLLDDRLHPYAFRCDEPLEMKAMEQLMVSALRATWVLSMFTMAELGQISGVLHKSPNVHIDIGCSKPFEFWEDDVRALAPVSQIIYGSGAPLYYHLGGRIGLSRFTFSKQEKQAIASGNLARMIERPLGPVRV